MRAPTSVRWALLLLVPVLCLGPSVGSAAAVGEGLRLPDPGGAREVAQAAAASEVLRRWDRRRAAAFAAGDPARLRGLYTRRSAAGAADVAVLEEYAARGLTVDRLTVQILRLRVLERTAGRLQLRVVDRVARASVRTALGRSLALPADQPTAHVLTFVRRGSWRLATAR